MKNKESQERNGYNGKFKQEYLELKQINEPEKVVKPIVSYGMAIGVLIGLGLQVTNTLLHLFHGNVLLNIEQKPPPTLVQTPLGESLEVEPIASNDRVPLSIRKFVKDNFWLLYNMPGKLIDKNGNWVNDEGVVTSTGKKVTTAAAVAADGALSTPYQAHFLAELSKITPQGIFNKDRNLIATLDFNSVGAPELIKPGHWKVRVVSYLEEKEQGQLKKYKILNKIVYVRAIEPSNDNPAPSTPLELIVAEITASRLEIYEIEDSE